MQDSSGARLATSGGRGDQPQPHPLSVRRLQHHAHAALSRPIATRTIACQRTLRAGGRWRSAKDCNACQLCSVAASRAVPCQVMHASAGQDAAAGARRPRPQAGCKPCGPAAAIAAPHSAASACFGSARSRAIPIACCSVGLQ